MKNVVHFWKTDYFRGGGGAIAMYRLHSQLRTTGVDSKILCNIKTLNTQYSKPIRRSRFITKIEAQIRKLTSRVGLNDLHCISSFLLNSDKWFRETDIINVHGLHGGFFNFLALPPLTKTKPFVFTLHDMWAFTGHCSYSYDCQKWKIGCGKCPYPNIHPPIRYDNTHFEWKLKKWAYEHSNISIVTLSKLQTEQVKQSILNCLPIYHIPNGIDTKNFEPLDSEQCRSLLKIPKEKKVLMFASLELNDRRKGSDLLLDALKMLPNSLLNDMVLLTIGRGDDVIGNAVGIESFNLGFICDDRKKAIAYSAADIFVAPTRADTLPLVLQESMACGTPPVAFNVGGVPDLVRPGITGYLAEPENSEDLSGGIRELLENPKLREKLGQSARQVALEEYTIELQAKRYIELYEKIIRI